MEKERKIEIGKPMNVIDGLELLFIGLKLAGKIDWSWWKVFLPYIIQFCGIVIVSIVFGFITNKTGTKFRF